MKHTRCNMLWKKLSSLAHPRRAFPPLTRFMGAFPEPNVTENSKEQDQEIESESIFPSNHGKVHPEWKMMDTTTSESTVNHTCSVLEDMHTHRIFMVDTGREILS